LRRRSDEFVDGPEVFQPAPEIEGADVVEHHDVGAVFLAKLEDADDAGVLKVGEECAPRG